MYMKKPNSTSLLTFLEDCPGLLQNLDAKHQQKIEEIGRASTLCSKQIETTMQLCPGVSLERMSVAYVLTDRVTSERCTHALANPSFCRHCSSGPGPRCDPAHLCTFVKREPVCLEFALAASVYAIVGCTCTFNLSHKSMCISIDYYRQ